MLCNFIKSLFVVICLLNMSLSYAGVIIGGTRVIFNSDRADETFSIFNKETNVPYLIQVWVEPFDKKEATPPPFTAIPPVSRLEPQQEKILRIIKTKGALPEDRESVFWLNIKNIPPSGSSADSNTMEIAIKTRIKLFWRPVALNMTPEKAYMKVKWQRVGNHLQIENPAPIHINVMDVFVDGKEIPLNMLKPFEKLALPLPAGAVGKALRWRFINDYGAISEPLNLSL